MNFHPDQLIITIDISNLTLIEAEQINRGMAAGFSLNVPSLLPAIFMLKSARWDMVCVPGDEA